MIRHAGPVLPGMLILLANCHPDGDDDPRPPAAAAQTVSLRRARPQHVQLVARILQPSPRRFRATYTPAQARIA
jgi:hypothetical protein